MRGHPTWRQGRVGKSVTSGFAVVSCPRALHSYVRSPTAEAVGFLILRPVALARSQYPSVRNRLPIRCIDYGNSPFSSLLPFPEKEYNTGKSLRHVS